MPDSWRNILERAAENLSADIEQERHYQTRQQSAGWRAPRKVTPPPFSLAYLLERERAVRPEDLPVPQDRRDRRLGRQGPARSSKALAARPAKSRKKGPLGEFVPAAISVGIVALIVYAIYNLLH